MASKRQRVIQKEQSEVLQEFKLQHLASGPVLHIASFLTLDDMMRMAAAGKQAAKGFVQQLVSLEMYGQDWELFAADAKRIDKWVTPAAAALRSMAIQQATRLPPFEIVHTLCSANRLRHVVLTMSTTHMQPQERVVAQTDHYLASLTSLGKQLKVLKLDMISPDPRGTAFVLADLLRQKRATWELQVLECKLGGALLDKSTLLLLGNMIAGATHLVLEAARAKDVVRVVSERCPKLRFLTLALPRGEEVEVESKNLHLQCPSLECIRVLRVANQAYTSTTGWTADDAWSIGKKVKGQSVLHNALRIPTATILDALRESNKTRWALIRVNVDKALECFREIVGMAAFWTIGELNIRGPPRLPGDVALEQGNVWPLWLRMVAASKPSGRRPRLRVINNILALQGTRPLESGVQADFAFRSHALRGDQGKRHALSLIEPAADAKDLNWLAPSVNDLNVADAPDIFAQALVRLLAKESAPTELVAFQWLPLAEYRVDETKKLMEVLTRHKSHLETFQLGMTSRLGDRKQRMYGLRIDKTVVRLAATEMPALRNVALQISTSFTADDLLLFQKLVHLELADAPNVKLDSKQATLLPTNATLKQVARRNPDLETVVLLLHHHGFTTESDKNKMLVVDVPLLRVLTLPFPTRTVTQQELQQMAALFDPEQVDDLEITLLLGNAPSPAWHAPCNPKVEDWSFSFTLLTGPIERASEVKKVTKHLFCIRMPVPLFQPKTNTTATLAWTQQPHVAPPVKELVLSRRTKELVSPRSKAESKIDVQELVNEAVDTRMRQIEEDDRTELDAELREDFETESPSREQILQRLARFEPVMIATPDLQANLRAVYVEWTGKVGACAYRGGIRFAVTKVWHMACEVEKEMETSQVTWLRQSLVPLLRATPRGDADPRFRARVEIEQFK